MKTQRKAQRAKISNKAARDIRELRRRNANLQKALLDIRRFAAAGIVPTAQTILDLTEIATEGDMTGLKQ